MLHSNAHDDQVFLYAFDLLEFNGEDYRNHPLEQAKLEKLLARTQGLRFSEHMDGDGETIFKHACKMGLEGILSCRCVGRENVVSIPVDKISLARFQPSQHLLSNHLPFNTHRFRTVPVAGLRSSRMPWFKRPWIVMKSRGLQNNDSAVFDQITLEIVKQVIFQLWIILFGAGKVVA
jgi:hypothetical protein